MKKTPLFLIAFIALTVTSCSFIQEIKTEAKEIDVFNLDKLEDEGELNKCKQTTLEMRFVPKEEYIPYLSLQQYASLYEPHYMAGARNEFKKDNNSVSWYIYVGEDLYFYTYISYTQKYILSAGNIENAFADDDNPRDLKALNYGLLTSGQFVMLGSQSYSRYSFADSNFTCFRNSEDIYMPLGFFDTAYSESAGIYFFYNYQNIYSTREADNFSEKKFTNAEGSLLTVDKEMKQSASSTNMPYYLISYNADLFLFLMNNFYGLKDLKGIKSMANYYRNIGVYNSLYSSDPAIRGRAYTLGLNCFDDNHTTLVSVNDTWGETAGAPFGEGVTLRRALRTELRKVRQNYYESYLNREEADGGDILYSQNEKTAMFHFESFAFGDSSQVFNEDESIKEEAYKYDTYVNFIRIFNEIKAKGTVENVIIDVSTNVGGTVGVMMKLLALVSKDNYANVCLCDETYMGVSSYDIKVDVDADGEYKNDEIFGDDFNIYIMTSDCSFSAGNAFPCYAQQLGAKVIGEKSGGGECAVAVHYLPNSQYVYHSSNLHLGYISDDYYTYIGLENGAPVDIDLTNNSRLCSFDSNDQIKYSIPSDFYDINALDNKIANYKS